MNKILAVFCLILVGAHRASADPFVTNSFAFLGSRTAIYLWQQNHIVNFSIALVVTNNSQRIYYPYSPAQGDLKSVIASKLSPQLKNFVPQSRSGTQVTVWIGFEWPLTRE